MLTAVPTPAAPETTSSKTWAAGQPCTISNAGSASMPTRRSSPRRVLTTRRMRCEKPRGCSNPVSRCVDPDSSTEDVSGAKALYSSLTRENDIMRKKHVAAAMACAGLWLGTTAVIAAQRGGTIWIRPGYYKELKPERHQAAVERMLRQDAAAPPPSEAVLFVGSATIAGWDIPGYFPEYKTIKRGIGGSLTSEATYWADRLVIPFKPSTVVFYSGDNDLGYGMTAEMVANEFEAFVRK